MAFSQSSVQISKRQNPVHCMAEPHELPVAKPFPILNFINQRGEHIGTKSNLSGSIGKKCEIYVHQLSKIPRSSSSYSQNNWQGGSEIHQIAYKHEKSDYYDAKVQLFKKQFDSLTLNERSIQYENTHSSPKQQLTAAPLLRTTVASNHKPNSRNTKIPIVKSNPTSKINHLLTQKSDQHKVTLDKLEEQYWAKWKPSKSIAPLKPYIKVKKSYSPKNEYEKPTFQLTTSKHISTEESEHPISRKSSTVSKENIMNTGTIQSTFEISESVSNNIAQTPEKDSEAEESKEEFFELAPSTHEEEDQVEDNPLPSDCSKESIPKEIVKDQDGEVECAVTNIKHTDSLILASKKQMQELGKPHYQQPKCIKLFKNVGCAPITMSNFIKGGSYPLKSCLKRDGVNVKPPRLARPGSPAAVGNNWKPMTRGRYSKS